MKMNSSTTRIKTSNCVVIEIEQVFVGFLLNSPYELAFVGGMYAPMSPKISS